MAQWEAGSCCCPRFTDEEAGALAHPAACPQSDSISPSESADGPKMPAPARSFIPGNALLWQGGPSGVAMSFAFLYTQFGFG